MNAIVLVAPPHDLEVAGRLFHGLVGDAWAVRAYNSQDEVPDSFAADPELIATALGRVDRSPIGRCPTLRLIQVPGHGYDHVIVPDAAWLVDPVAAS